jgi:type I restriction enzyme, S subunit
MWKTTKLGELLEVQNGYAFNSKKFNSQDGMPLIRIRDLKNGLITKTYFTGEYEKKYIVHSGDFLIGMDGEFYCYQWKGKDALLNQRVCRLQNFSQKLNPKFLHYVINKQLKLIEDKTGFTTVKHLSSNTIKEIQISIPTIQEQERIVAKLDTIFVEIDKQIIAANYKKNEVDKLKKNIFAKKFKLNSNIVKLGDLCEVITKGTTPTSLGFKFIDKGINFIKIQSINNNGDFIKDKFAYINKDCNEKLNRSKLQVDDILFSIAGAIGRTAIVTEEILPANTNQALAILRLKKDIKINKKFLLYSLNSDGIIKQSDAFKGGTAQQNLSLSQLKSYNIPLPSLLDQKDIVTILDLISTRIHELKNCIQAQIRNYQTLYNAILRKELRN